MLLQPACIFAYPVLELSIPVLIGGKSETATADNVHRIH